jgi:hypothetical protein
MPPEWWCGGRGTRLIVRADGGAAGGSFDVFRDADAVALLERGVPLFTSPAAIAVRSSR